MLLKRRTVVGDENCIYSATPSSQKDLSPKTAGNQLYDPARDLWSFGMVSLFCLLKLQGREEILEGAGEEKRDIKAYISSKVYPLLSKEEAGFVECCLCGNPYPSKIRQSSYFADLDFDELLYEKIISEEVNPSKRLYSKTQSRLSQGRSKLADSLLQSSQLFDSDKRQSTFKKPLMAKHPHKFNSFSAKGIL